MISFFLVFSFFTKGKKTKENLEKKKKLGSNSWYWKVFCYNCIKFQTEICKNANGKINGFHLEIQYLQTFSQPTNHGFCMVVWNLKR